MLGDKILAIAAREIGYHEGKNQHSKYGEWSGWDNAPWCMSLVQWVYAEAGAALPYKTASCGALLNWYRANQPDCITKEPVRGCIVIFNFPNTSYATDHTGLFVSKTLSKITTIDGNTTNGNESNGGWVQQRTRNLNYANPIYIVPKELGVSMDIDLMLQEITDEQAYKLYSKAVRHMSNMPLPTSWEAAKEWDEAKALGITDGSIPMCPASRLQAAIMCKRAVRNK